MRHKVESGSVPVILRMLTVVVCGLYTELFFFCVAVNGKGGGLTWGRASDCLVPQSTPIIRLTALPLCCILWRQH